MGVQSFSITFFLLLLPFLLASAHPGAHVASRTLPSQTWFHDDKTAGTFSNLFRRDSTQEFAQVGSSAWAASYPTSTPDVSKTPAQWTAALAAAVAAGKIPDVPVSISTGGGSPKYPNNADPYSADICSSSAKCKADGDVWNAPDGFMGISFDDGPTFEYGDALCDFLKSQNQTATHFMIGMTILQNPNGFLHAFNNGDDIAVHTYTHPQMTTLSNADVLAQLGWTMQIIHDSTGGKVPKFWRPPTGDADNRVRAIAKEVFGLTMVMWNQDPRDWSVNSAGGTTYPQIQSDLAGWIGGPQSPGLIILEHELYNETVSAFIGAYPQIVAKGWKPVSVAQLVPSAVDGVVGQTYWNGPLGSGEATSDSSILDFGSFSESSPSPLTTPSSTSTSTTTSSTSTSSPLSTPSPQSATTTTSAGFSRYPFHIISWTLLFSILSTTGLTVC